MELLLKIIESCAMFGANCASVVFSCQPKLPECMKK